MILKSLALLLLGIVPHDDVARESVDLFELNHFYDEHGRLVFDQIIFYDWQRLYVAAESTPATVERNKTPADVEEKRYQVRAWRLIKNPCQIPYRDWRQGGYSVCWQDGEQMRFIRSPSFRETWTQYDPELIEREFLPKEKRRELLVLKKPKVKNGKSTAVHNPGDGPPGEVPAAADGP